MTNKISHEILNHIERLKIMHEIAKEKNFQDISKEELVNDLDETLEKLKDNFKELLQ